MNENTFYIIFYNKNSTAQLAFELKENEMLPTTFINNVCARNNYTFMYSKVLPKNLPVLTSSDIVL